MPNALTSLMPPPAAAGFDLPEPLRTVAAWAFALQRQLNGELRADLAVIRDHGLSWAPVMTVIAGAFLYGVFHAIGPGHGKTVIGSWFLSRRARLVDGLAACAVSALVQAGTAIALVGAVAGLAALAPRVVMAQAAWAEAGSYLLITLLGGWMLIQAARGRDSCGHDHGQAHMPSCACGHDHHDHDHGHDGHRHPETAPPRRDLFAMAAAIGLRPCSGAILVLLFTLANNLFWLGMLATLAMAAGVALTVSGIGLSALGLNRLLARGGDSAGKRVFRRAVAVAGAGAVFLLGAVLLLGVIQNGPALTG